MRQGLLNGALFQVAALITSVIIVHMAYVAVIRPNAEIVSQQQEYLQQTDPEYTPERSFYVVLRDFEQETCIILFLWATAIIGLKAKQTLGDRKLLDRNLLQVTGYLWRSVQTRLWRRRHRQPVRQAGCHLPGCRNRSRTGGLP